MNIGYYLFLGSGDYHPPNKPSSNWVYTWNLAQWKEFIDLLGQYEVNTLFLYFNGHKLPYRSDKYPSLQDNNSESVKADFIPELLCYIRKKGISVIAVVTTTGHAGGFLSKNEHAGIQVPIHFDIDKKYYEQMLISFPKHIRQGKLDKKNGAAQLGHGVLCHNKDKARIYATDILQEILSIYGKYLNGIALHPPETVCPCFCDICNNAFFEQQSMKLEEVSFNKAREFFIESYMKFQMNHLIPIIENSNLNIGKYLFTIPWFFESNFNLIESYIPKDVKLVDWDYNLNKERVNGLGTRLHKYKSSGFDVCFMPSAGFSFSESEKVEEQTDMVHLQMNIAAEAGCKGIVHFLGAKLSEHIDSTSWVKCQNSNKNITTLSFK